MSRAFDFTTTPITGNTTLVARYRSTSGGGAYGGNWFRVTTDDGKRYVPTSLGEANAFSKTGDTQLQNEDTGERVVVAGSSVVGLELGGGWEGGNAGTTVKFFPIATYFEALTRVSGYAEGLTKGVGSTGEMFYGFNTSSQTSHVIDFTGFRFNNNQFAMLSRDGCPFTPSFYGTAGEGGVWSC